MICTLFNGNARNCSEERKDASVSSKAVQYQLCSCKRNGLLLPPATKLGQGNVFTSVCDSVHRGGGVHGRRGHAWPGGVHDERGHAWQRGCAWQKGVRDEGVCVMKGDVCGEGGHA